MLFIIATVGVLLSMALVILRGMKGPTIYDRVLSANAFGTNTVVMIALLGFSGGNEMFLDIALIYGLINFITTIAYLRYFKYGTFGEH